MIIVNRLRAKNTTHMNQSMGGFVWIFRHGSMLHDKLNFQIPHIESKRDNNIIFHQLLLRWSEGGSEGLGDMPGVVVRKAKGEK